MQIQTQLHLKLRYLYIFSLFRQIIPSVSQPKAGGRSKSLGAQTSLEGPLQSKQTTKPRVTFKSLVYYKSMKNYSREWSFWRVFFFQSKCKGLFLTNEKKERITWCGSEVLSEIPASITGNQIPFTRAVSCSPLVMNAPISHSLSASSLRSALVKIPGKSMRLYWCKAGLMQWRNKLSKFLTWLSSKTSYCF